MAKLKDDQIKWILSLDAKGVQSEITTLSSQSKDLGKVNKLLESDLKAANKQMRDAEKEMERLRKAGKDSSKEFGYARDTYHDAANEVDNFRKQIANNNKQIDENNRKVDEMVRTLKTEEMTMSQLKKRAKELESQLEHTSEATHPEQYSALEKKLNAVKKRMNELKGASQSTFSVLKGGLAVLAGNLMTKAVDKIKEWASAAKEWVAEGINMYKGAEGQIKFFKQLSGSTQIMKDLKEATSGTVSELELMNKTLRAKEMGIPIQNMADLMDYARRQAQKLGKDVDYMANSIVDGIGRKSTLVLDNLGISATKVQAEVKKTGDFTQGVLKIVNEELEKQGNYALTSADKAAQSAVKWENAQLKVGTKFKWLGELWDKVSGNMADGIARMVGETRTANEVFDDQLDKVAKLNVETEPLIDKYEELSQKVKLNYDQTKELNPEQEELLSIINQIKDAIPGVVTEFDKYGRAIGINTEKAREFIRTQVAMLKYMNRDAIEDTEKNIDEYTTRIEILKKAKDRGGYTSRVGGSNVSPGTEVFYKYSPEDLGKIEDEISEIEQLRTGAQERLKQINGQALEDQSKTNESRIRHQNQFNEMNKAQLDAWIKDEKNAADEYIALAKQIYDQRFGTNPDTDPKKPKGDPELTRQRKELNTLRETIETKHNEKLAKINQDYLDGKIKSESEYNRRIFSQEQANFILRENALKAFHSKTTKEELKTDVSKEISQLHNQRLQREIAFQKELEKIILEANPEEKERIQYENRLRELGIFGKSKEHLQLELIVAETEQEKNLIQKKLEALELLEKQHQDNLFSIRRQAKNREKAQSEEQFESEFKARKDEMQKELADKEQQVTFQTGVGILNGDAAFKAELEVHNMRLEMIREEIAARQQFGLETTKLTNELIKREQNLTKSYVNEFNRRKQEYTKYGQDIGRTVGNVIAGQEDALSAFSGVLIDLTFDTLTHIINAEITKTVATATGAIARTTAEQIASSGFLGIGKAAILTGIITAAMTAARTALKGLINKSKKGASDSSGSSGTTYKRIESTGYADGGYHSGYTGPGDKYDIKGYFSDGQPYHADEYIIPKIVVRNPRAVPLIRELENMRNQYSSKNPLPRGFAEGGFHESGITDGSGETNIDRLEPTLRELNSLLAFLKSNGVKVNIYEFAQAQEVVDDFENFGKKV